MSAAPILGGSAGPSPSAGSRVSSAVTRVGYYLPALLVAVGTLVLWEVVVGALAIKAFIFPQPSAIYAALIGNWASPQYPLFVSAQSTLYEAAGGLVIGTTAGVVVAFATSRWATTRGILLPIAIAANAVPIIAFAPLFNNWFGVLAPLSKMMMAAVLVFFPVMANVTRGLTQVDPSALELMRSYAAGQGTILRKVRIPNALPYFFTALKLATTLSLIGAIVGEYFGGSSTVLGRVIVQSASTLRFDVTWAAIVLTAITGITFYLVTVLLERIVIPWHASLRATEN